MPGGKRDHGLLWAQMIVGCFEADENSPWHAKTSTYQMSMCGAAAHKSLRKSGSCEGQEMQVEVWGKTWENINRREKNEVHQDRGGENRR